MNNNSQMPLDKMLRAIEGYSFLRDCFSDYLKWLFEECDEKRRKNDAIFFKIATGANSLGDLENLFQEFGNALGMNEMEFRKAFRLDVDRNKKEILKIGDLLAEPWAAIALRNHGFNSIRKISATESKICDFTANYGSRKFAIEVKNLRSQEVEDHYLWLNNTTYNNQDVILSSYYGNSQGELHKREEATLQDRMTSLLENEPRRHKISEQLTNGKMKYECQSTMLIGSLDLIMILGEFPKMILDDLEKMANQFHISDYLACCFNQQLFCSPQLS